MAAGGHAKCMAQNTKLNVVVVEQSNTHTVIIMHNIDEKGSCIECIKCIIHRGSMYINNVSIVQQLS